MPELPFDGDLSDPSQRCEHGTFIGSWWGPDYMCGACEDGISMEDCLLEAVEHAQRRKEHFWSLVFGEYGKGIAGDSNCLYRALGGIGWETDLGKALLATMVDLDAGVDRCKAALAKHREALVG